MAEFTLDELRRIMLECVGDSDAIELDGAIDDVDFADLGYDSLAVLEIAAKVGQAYGISMPDESVEVMTTPARAVDYVNQRLTGAPA